MVLVAKGIISNIQGITISAFSSQAAYSYSGHEYCLPILSACSSRQAHMPVNQSCAANHTQTAVFCLEAESKAHPDVGKLRGKLTCQASRGRRVHPPSAPVPEAATTALAALHPPWPFLGLATRQYPWPDLLPHCSQHNDFLEKHPSLKSQPSQQSSLPVGLYYQYNITCRCTHGQHVSHVNACQMANRCTSTVQSIYSGAMHIIPSTSRSHSHDLLPGCEQHLVKGGNPV